MCVIGGGTILLFSVPKPGAHHSLNLEDVFNKELKIVGSRINPNTHARAVSLINSGRIPLDRLITHTYPLEKLEEAIIKQTENDSIKVVVEPLI